MRGILLLNGEGYLGEIDDKNALVLCCDGAYRWAKGELRIDENVGDFDSLDEVPFPPPQEIYPSQKDFTDGEIALRKLLAAGCNEVELYGGGGGREDHFLGNLQLLYYALTHGVKATMVTNYSTIFLAQGKTEIVNSNGKTVSLVPFGGKAHIRSGQDFFYPYDDLWLENGTCRGISNVALSDEAWFDCDQGQVLVFIDR